MKLRTRNLSLALVTLATLTGCETMAVRKRATVSAFIPPPPVRLPEERYALEEPPTVSLLAKESPMLLAAAAPEPHVRPTPIPQRSMEVELRLGRAQGLFEKGADLVAKGDISSARIEFDRALEVLSTAPAELPERSRLARRHAQLAEEIYRIEVDQADATQGAEASPVYDRPPIESIAEMTFPIEPGLKGKVIEQLRATVSQLPLQVTDPVLQFLNYFTTPRGSDVVKYGKRRGGRYLPMIRRILDEEGVPPELYYLAQAESAFLPRAVSRKRATGMWQFIQSRGQEYGLKQTPFTDDRMDPEKATRAAAKHLKDLYAQFGDWHLAIAAYNCGPYAVERAVQKTGYADFWELYRRNNLPRETANYLPIILALTIMGKNEKAYGLDGVTVESALEYETIKSSTPTHLALVADAAGRPLSELQELNPAVLRLLVPADYPIHLPKGFGKTVLAALDRIPADKRAKWRIHRVAGQETLASIASKYRLAERNLLEANGRSDMAPEEGDFVVVPVAYPGADPETRVTAKKATTRTAVRRGRGAARPVASKKPSAPNRMASSTKRSPATASKKPVQTARVQSSRSARGM